MPRRLFTVFNLAGAALWSGLIILIGFTVAQLPGVTDFVSRYIDIVLIGIVLVSVVPIVVRTIVIRGRNSRSSREPD